MRQQAGIPARMTVTDQNGAAAQLTGAQYASVMGAYNAFQNKVRTSIVNVLSEVVRLPSGVAVQMRHNFGTNAVQVVVPNLEEKIIVENPWKLLIKFNPFLKNPVTYLYGNLAEIEYSYYGFTMIRIREYATSNASVLESEVRTCFKITPTESETLGGISRYRRNIDIYNMYMKQSWHFIFEDQTISNNPEEVHVYYRDKYVEY